MNSIDKLDLRTPDFVSANIEKLAALFPHCVTESADGKKIDFDLLQQELCNDIVEGNRERYRLEWPGKREAIVTANMPTTKTLCPVRKDSVDFDNTENLYIEGDNLEVLKLLQESYFGKIKMIYIDPPYNTGNDFVYKDDFATDRETELFESGQIDEYNRRMVANPETSGRYHSDWLTMMYPRLKLARNLLTNDGVIFISIDDNEVHNLRKICDEVFGEDNFVANVTVIVKPEGRRYGFFAKTHEQILVFAKNINETLLNEIHAEGSSYQYFDEIGGFNLKGLRNRNVQAFNSSNRPNLRYPFYVDINNHDNNGLFNVSVEPLEGYVKVMPSTIDGLKSVWRWSKEKSQKENELIKAYSGKDGEIRIFQKERKLTQTPKTVLFDKNFISNKGTSELQNIIGKSVFDFPKPMELLKLIIGIGVNDSDIILDFFSGSATTAHAVMQLNAEDGGNRKYIMVQLPEQTDEKSEAYKAGYQNICEIGKERIRRAANKVKEEKRSKTEKEGLFANVEDTQDYGFRVYRLADSNMQDVYYRPQDYKQESMDMFADNIKPDRTADDLLAQVMLDWGLPLSYKIDQASINGKQVFRVAQDSLLACFDKGIDEAFAKEIAKEKPLRVVFRDSGFASDTAKINVQQLLKQLTPETEMKVI